MLSKELPNRVFTDIAFGVCHTYSHWRSNTSRQIPAAWGGGG